MTEVNHRVVYTIAVCALSVLKPLSKGIHAVLLPGLSCEILPLKVGPLPIEHVNQAVAILDYHVLAERAFEKKAEAEAVRPIVTSQRDLHH